VGEGMGRRRAIKDGTGKALKVSRECRLYILGAALCVALTICSRFFSDRGGAAFMVSLTLACIAYLFAIREFFRGQGIHSSPAVASIAKRGVGTTQELPRRVVIIGLLLAAAWHIAFLRLPPGPDDDIHRYVWDGRLQRLGYNPYLVIPSDPAVAGLHTSETRNLNNPDLPSPYPPGAQLFFRAVTVIHESVFAFKVAFAACELAIVLILLDLFKIARRQAHVVLAFAWNPLLAIEVAGSGHIDILGALLLVISVAALARRWRTAAAVTLGLAVAVKFLPIVLLPLYWKRVRVRDAAPGAGIVALLYLPFLHHGRISLGSLATYVHSFRFNGPVFAILDHVAPPQLLAALAALAGFVIAIRLRRSMPDCTPDQLAWPMAASLFCAPAVFPWYLLWLLPFLTSPSTLVLIVWSVSIIPTYLQWHLRTLGHAWGALPVWIMLVEYGCVAVTATVMLARRLVRTPAFNRQTD